MLTLTDFSKRYHEHLVLRIPELTFKPGLYWIKGENGAGKSTLFKCIAGIIPFEGDIRLGNLSVKDDAVSFRRRVNYAEAEPVYPGFVTAKDIVRFIGKAKGAPIPEQDRLCDQFGVNLYFNSTCDTFSSGMLKKLSLVCAFLGEGELIILDEPLITLDEEARKTLFSIVTDFAARGSTFLISSHHNLGEAELPLTGRFIIRNKCLQDA